MAFVNLPPNLQDMFNNLQDQINKLVTGPNQAMYYAESAQALAITSQSTASNAQTQAINAAIQANIAQSQATIAQSQATIASSQATLAQQSANGKNTVYYGTSATPNTASITGLSANGSTVTYSAYNGFIVGQTVVISGITPIQFNGTYVITAASFTQFAVSSAATGLYSTGGSASISGLSYKVGDLYFQYNTSSQVVAQYSWNGSSWQSTPITNTVITNLDAGKITTGILNAIQIQAGSGGQYFTVSPSGYMSAQGAYIKGNITADSGTFNGTLYSANGYFGTPPNYWSINSSGLTGVGTATITGGLIQGSSIAVPNSGSYNFAVDSSGNMTAKSGTIGGVTIGSATLTGGTIQTSAGSTAVKLVGATNSIDFINAGTTVGKIYPWSSNGIYLSYGTGSYPASYVGASTAVIAGSSLNSIASGSSSNSISGITYAYDSVHIVNSYLYVDYASSASTTAATNCYISSTGQILKTSTTSSLRYKENITDISNVAELDPKLLLQIPVKAFSYVEGHIKGNDDRVGQMLPGLIAEDVDAVYPIATDYANGNVETWSERYIIPGLLALIQDQEKRITILEGK